MGDRILLLGEQTTSVVNTREDTIKGVERFVEDISLKLSFWGYVWPPYHLLNFAGIRLLTGSLSNREITLHE